MKTIEQRRESGGFRVAVDGPRLCGAWFLWLWLALHGHTELEAAGVIFDEVMYHPASEDTREEYIELHNTASTNVNVTGWRLSRGIAFTFTNSTVIPAGGWLVVAADRGVFVAKHPGVTNVVGDWAGILSNSGEEITLEDATGGRVDSVEYADEGDWAVRARGPVDRNHQGWVWRAPHDGGGYSLELINPALPNDHGQNWGASTALEGTPGRANSISRTNGAPMVLEVAHLPPVPRSADPVLVTLRLLDETTAGLSARLHYRLDAVAPAPFTTVPLHDDGLHDDGGAADGIYAGLIPPQTNHAIVEFYVEAEDGTGLIRTWPGPAVDTNGVTLGQTANALYQVDDTAVPGPSPLYKLIMREVERAELAAIGSTSSDERNSDAQMNGAFVSLDGSGTTVRYLAGIRNRGHGSRSDKPNNYRVNFAGDRRWKGVRAVNLNAQFSHAQHIGAVLSQKSGVAGADARAVQVRVNNVNLGNNGPQTYGGMYVANEVNNSDWAEHWFPDDNGGNIYRAIRDIPPSDFIWRGDNPSAYTNTWFKATNESEDDWSDLIGMLRILGTNDQFTVENVRGVANVEQWMNHLAVMALLNTRETGLNLGYNDDYYLYAGRVDRRFILMFYDLDSILGEGETQGATTDGIFGVTQLSAFDRLLRHPEFEPIYYRTLQRLLDTTFSAAQFNATIDQTLGAYVPRNVIDRMIQWMDARRAHVAGLIAGHVPPSAAPPVAIVTGVPRSPTPFRSATLTVGGAGIVEYRHAVGAGPFGSATPVAAPISLGNLPNGSTNFVRVIGRNAAGAWQSEAEATVTPSWIVATGIPPVRISEVLARNVAAINHQNTFPDLIELHNEGTSGFDVSGLRLTDNPAAPSKFEIPAGTTIPAGGYLVVYANNPDGTPGLHAGFSLDQSGEGVHLFDRAAAGGRLLDSVLFGLQAPDLSIGRLQGREFVVGPPTPGAPNVAAPAGNPAAIRLNEWLAAPFSLFSEDFLELHNSSTNPVALGGLFLTDNPIGEPRKHAFAPLSFIGAGGYLALRADGDPGKGADHVAFRLSGEQGMIALLAGDLSPLDCVNYGPQSGDISQGRTPNGGDRFAFFLQPTPGAPNPLIDVTTVTQTVELVTLTNRWRYNQTANLDGVNWMAPGFDDVSWPEGAALLYVDPDPLPAPTNTPLAIGRTTYYFRTRFNWTGPANGVTLWLSPMVDDGAVFYLNGQRVFAVGVATNTPPLYATLASRTVNNASVEGPFGIPAGSLTPGMNLLAAEVHQSGPNSQDIVMGAGLEAVLVVTNPPSIPVRLNELLANNRTLTNAVGALPDWIELINTSTNPFDLAEFSLTDDPQVPRKWVFPAATVLAPGERRLIECDGDRPASATNSGFALSASGEGVYLFDRPADGGALLDSVVFGVQAADFPIARDPEGYGPWVLALPTPGGANLRASTGDPTRVRLNEWLADPLDGPDWFELFNPNLQPVDLSGLALSDDALDRDKSPIPALSFLGAGTDAYVGFIADGDRGQGADHVAFSLGASGDSVGLYLPGGTAIDSMTFGTQAPDVSEGRFPDGAGLVTRFPGSASPASSNYRLLPSVVINELLSHTDPPLEDAIEFHNPGTAPVDIGGWWLSNSERELNRFVVPSGMVLSPGGFGVLYEYQFGVTGASGSRRPFTFNSAHGDAVFLTQTDASGNPTGYRAAVRYGAATNGVSFGRVVTSAGVDFAATTSRSFGNDAPGTPIELFRQGGGKVNPSPRVGPIVINEIMYHPTDLPGGIDNAADEFIELLNMTAQAVPLYDPDASTNRWKLDGAVSYRLPPGLSLPPGGFLVLVGFDPAGDPAALAAFRQRYAVPDSVTVLGPWSGTLGNRSEGIELYRPDPPQGPQAPDAGFVPQVLVERIQYGDTSPWPLPPDGNGPSLQRRMSAQYGNEPLNWVAAEPTAGRSNTASPGDADADGMPDDWETLHFGSPADPRAQPGLDVDEDGLANLGEYLAGTDPLDPASVLRVDEIRSIGGGDVEIRFRAMAARSYTLESADELFPLNWRKLLDVAPMASDGNVTLSDSPPPTGRYYRLVTPAQP